MQASVSYLTLGVADVARAHAFYHEVLGWPSKGLVGAGSDYGEVAFFKLENGMKLALWQHESLAQFTGVALAPAATPSLMLSHNVPSAADVDALYQALPTTAQVRAPRALPWGGYGAVFQDPDGHLWELVHNPSV